jgi:large subunit ribosomal protein L21
MSIFLCGECHGFDTRQERLIQFSFWRSDIYAIVETGGKQYRVTPGQVIEVDFLDAVDGTSIELDKVLFIGDGSTVVTGKPTIEGAKVLATSQGDIKGEKTIAFKYKNKTRYHRKIGHREKYSKLAIDKIVMPEGLKTEQG